jgi:hypothetical protein
MSQSVPEVRAFVVTHVKNRLNLVKRCGLVHNGSV